MPHIPIINENAAARVRSSGVCNFVHDDDSKRNSNSEYISQRIPFRNIFGW